MSDHTDLAARLRHCHAAAFGLDKCAWTEARDCERVRWELVAERYHRYLNGSRNQLVLNSGWWLYLSWDIDAYGVPWTALSMDRRRRWMDAAHDAMTCRLSDREAA